MGTLDTYNSHSNSFRINASFLCHFKGVIAFHWAFVPTILAYSDHILVKFNMEPKCFLSEGCFSYTYVTSLDIIHNSAAHVIFSFFPDTIQFATKEKIGITRPFLCIRCTKQWQLPHCYLALLPVSHMNSSSISKASHQEVIMSLRDYPIHWKRSQIKTHIGFLLFPLLTQPGL